MKSSNRISILLLSLIFSACSITNILAETNLNSDQTEISIPSLPADVIPAPTDPSASSADTAAQDPLNNHLTILITLCDDIQLNIDNGFLTLTKPKVIEQELKELKGLAQQLLTDFKATPPDLRANVLIEMVLSAQLEQLTDLINDKRAAPINIDDKIKALDELQITANDFIAAVSVTDQKFQQLGNTVIKKSKSKLDRVNDQALKQLCIVDMLLEELALYVNNDSIHVQEKSKTIDEIAAIRAVIEPCKYDRSQVTEQRVYRLLDLSTKLMVHIKVIIKNNFTSIPALDADAIFKDGPKDISLEELEAKYTENAGILEALRKDSQDAGLHWYNHVARKISAAWTYLDAGNRLQYIAAGLFAASVIAHQSQTLPDAIKNYKIPFTHMPLYGETAQWIPVMDQDNKPVLKPDGTVMRELTNGDKMGILARGWDFFQQSYFSNPVFAVPAAMAFAGAASDYRELKRWSREKLSDLSYFLLGTKPSIDTKQITRVEPKYNFKDIIGQDEIKEDLSKIVRYFEDPQSIDNRGLKLEKGFLFTGKTRSGKSFTAEALAGEITQILEKRNEKFNFFVAPIEMIRQPADPARGVPSGFKICMDYARQNSPCILFFDEAHLLELQTGKNNALLSEMLTELSGCMSNDPQSKVFVIAATNHEDSIDKALRSSGRLGKEIHFEYPTLNDRRTFITDILEKRSVNIDTINIEKFARETERCTFEDIRKVIEDAFITAKFNIEALSQRHLDQSFDKNIRGILHNYGRPLSAQEEELIAIHQAGYTLATKLLAPQDSIAQVTILPVLEEITEKSISDQYAHVHDSKSKRVTHGKLFTYRINHDDTLKTVQEQINACTVAVSGYAAGNALLGQANNSATYLAKKRQEAFKLAVSIVSGGIDLESLPEKIKTKYDERAMKLLNACEKRATELMEKNKDLLKIFTGGLLEYKSLTGQDIEGIIKQYPPSITSIDPAIFNLINDND